MAGYSGSPHTLYIDGFGRQGMPLSDQAKAAISAALTGRPHPHAGHPLSPETRAKISAALKGRTRGGRHRRRRRYIPHPRARSRRRHRSGRRKYVPHPRQRHPRKRHSAARAHHPRATHLRRHTGKKHPHKGHHPTAETRAKLAAALRGRRHPHKGHPGRHAATRHPGTRARPHSAYQRSTRFRGAPHQGGKRLTQRLYRMDPTGEFHAGGRHGKTALGRVHHTRKALISAATRHILVGYVHTKTRHHRTRLVVRKTWRVRAHRVWRTYTGRTRRRRL